MKKRILSAPSPALVISLIALFVALGGTSLAAASYINGKQIKNHTIAVSKLTRKAVKSLRGKRGLTGPQGTRGPSGAQGLQGVQGAAGAANVVVRTHTDPPLPTGVFDVMAVSCNPGERAVGGGGGFTTNGGHEVIQQSYPLRLLSGGTTYPAAAGDTPTAWLAIVQNNNGSALTPEVWVICASP